jgi:hypothetical protein
MLKPAELGVSTHEESDRRSPASDRPCHATKRRTDRADRPASSSAWAIIDTPPADACIRCRTGISRPVAYGRQIRTTWITSRPASDQSPSNTRVTTGSRRAQAALLLSRPLSRLDPTPARGGSSKKRKLATAAHFRPSRLLIRGSKRLCGCELGLVCGLWVIGSQGLLRLGVGLR